MSRLSAVLTLVIAGLLAGAAFPVLAEDATGSTSTPIPTANSGFGWEFFAFDNGVGRGAWPPEKQAELLAELGYDGIGYTGCRNIPAMLSALKKQELSFVSTYVGGKVTADGYSYDPKLPEAIEALRGTDAILWLFIQGEGSDEQCVKLVREVADLAARAGLRVCLYPHLNFFVESVADGVRIVEKVDRKNVGTAFNLCHWLKEGKLDALDATLADVSAHLMLVSINGADEQGTWTELIRPLGQGQYDVYTFLKKLHATGYTGPVGLQCFRVPGEPQDHLAQSMKAWKQMNARFTAEFHGAGQPPSGFELRDDGAARLTVLENGKPRFTYNYGDIEQAHVPENDTRKRRACYIHPLYGFGGEVLTGDAPKDHYHHHGVFWSWPHIAIEGEGSQGKHYSSWERPNVFPRLVKWIKKSADANSAAIQVENGWFIQRDGEWTNVLKEELRLVALPAANGCRATDVRLTLTPGPHPVTLRGAGGKSYGGMTMRLNVWPRKDGVVTVPGEVRRHVGRGLLSEEDLSNTPLPWATLTTTVPGASGPSTAGFFVHPRHPSYPPTWLTRSYGALCVGWPGVKAKTLEPGKSYTLSYRMVVYQGEVTPEQVAKDYAEFVKE